MQLKRLKILCLAGTSFLIGCAIGGVPPGFNWSPTLFVGDSKTQSVQGSNENIKCSDEKLDALVCMSRSELEKLPQLIDQMLSRCEIWKK
jgi:hypothetical protein